MKIEKQTFSLPIINYDDMFVSNQFKKHGVIFGGSSKRALIVGPSDSGKTNIALSLIFNENGLRFTNIYLYSKSLYQDKYEYLRKVMQPLTEIGYHEYQDGEEVISPEQIEPYSLIIFDDVVSCNQDIIKKYFCFGRHKNIDCFYLCQTYSSIAKRLLRDNANLLVIFQQDMTNLKHIYDDHVSVDMSFNNFKTLCGSCWEKKYDFLVIDKDCSLTDGRYRKGFDHYIKI